MVSYDCHYCNSGKQEQITIIRGNIKYSLVDCDICMGTGHMRNGKPEGLGIEVGITDPNPIWKEKWGKEYAKERVKGLWFK